MQLKLILEDVFAQQVEESYADVLKAKGYNSPATFDRDALQLGVIFEMGEYKNFDMALARAMVNLEANEHYYDDVFDIGQRESDIVQTNQVTWTGHPGQGQVGI